MVRTRKAGRNAVTLVMILVLVLIAACAPPPGKITPTPTPASPPPTPEPTPPEMPKTGFFLTVTEPADNSIINANKVEVGGHTSPGAVVSVNGELAEVDEEGNFTMTVVLEEGPNIIEVIASDLEGNEESHTLVVIYVP